MSRPDPQADLDWLYARQRFGIHPGLSRVRALLAALGDPQQHFRTVLVGGTNGKGSTAASLAAMLTASGERAALFTSPHLTRFSERFVVAGQELPLPGVLSALGELRPHAERLEASFFEVVVALGCLLFARAGASWAVMEVGLGGRLDATNVLEPVLSVITGVALDHTEVLGDTLEAIAGEKAGILRSGRPAVTGVGATLDPILRATGADLWRLGAGGEAGFSGRPLGWDGWAVTLRSPAGVMDFGTPLLGRHGAANAALAALAAVRLELPEEAIRAGAASLRWPGRLERLAVPGGTLLLDGAHNPDGAGALAAALLELGAAPVPLLFGAAGDKDVPGVLQALRPVVSRLILTRALNSPRAADPDALAALVGERWPQLPLEVTHTPQLGLERLLAALGEQQAAVGVVCGSLYLLGEVRPLLTGEAGEAGERWQ